jgi:GT2 family glycosyltransferase
MPELSEDEMNDLARELTVCICTRNRPESLRRTLASIARHAPAASVVVSDDGEESARSLVESFPNYRWQRGPATGLGANRNAVVAAVETGRVLFLDDDAELGPGFVEAIEETLDHLDPGVRSNAIVTGRERQGDLLVAPNDVDFLGFQKRPYGPGAELHTVVINAAVWPTALFESVTFDESLRYGSDEVDLSYKALRAGFRIIDCPTAVNEHHPSPVGRADYSLQAHASRLRASVRRAWRGAHRWPRTAAFLAVAPPHLFLALLRREGPRGIGGFVRVLNLWLRG